MQPAPAKILGTHIFQLDVLRGLAVLLVMCFHFFKGFSFGWVGVELFFVLSGFLITGKLAELDDSPGSIRAFYINRILRIVPLYYLVLVFFFLLFPIIAPSSVSGSFHQLLNDQLYYWTFSVNIVEAKKGWPANITLIHFWSLACEMQFYLVWPLAIIWINRNREKRKLLLWFLVLMALVFRILVTDYLDLHPMSRYVLLFSRMDAFAIGGLAYFYLTSTAYPDKKKPAVISILSLIVILSLCFIYRLNWHYSNHPVQMVGYSLDAFFWGGFLIYCCLTSINKYFLSRFLATLGKYSYAMYVFHLPIWIFLEKFLHSWQSSTPIILAQISAFIITFLLAWMSYHLYEKYFLRLKPSPQHA